MISTFVYMYLYIIDILFSTLGWYCWNQFIIELYLSGLRKIKHLYKSSIHKHSQK